MTCGSEVVGKLTVSANLKMSIFGETKCNFSPVSTAVYTALMHHFTCRLEARQALIYQLVLGLTGENGKYNDSRAVLLYPPFFDILSSAKNCKIALALTQRVCKNGDSPPSPAKVNGKHSQFVQVVYDLVGEVTIPETLDSETA